MSLGKTPFGWVSTKLSNPQVQIWVCYCFFVWVHMYMHVCSHHQVFNFVIWNPGHPEWLWSAKNEEGEGYILGQIRECLLISNSESLHIFPTPPRPMPFLCQSVHTKIAKAHLKTFSLTRANNICWVLIVCQTLPVLRHLIFRVALDGCTHICIIDEDMRHEEVAESHWNPWLFLKPVPLIAAELCRTCPVPLVHTYTASPYYCVKNHKPQLCRHDFENAFYLFCVSKYWLPR